MRDLEQQSCGIVFRYCRSHFTLRSRMVIVGVVKGLYVTRDLTKNKSVTRESSSILAVVWFFEDCDS